MAKKKPFTIWTRFSRKILAVLAAVIVTAVGILPISAAEGPAYYRTGLEPFSQYGITFCPPSNVLFRVQKENQGYINVTVNQLSEDSFTFPSKLDFYGPTIDSYSSIPDNIWTYPQNLGSYGFSIRGSYSSPLLTAPHQYVLQFNGGKGYTVGLNQTAVFLFYMPNSTGVPYNDVVQNDHKITVAVSTTTDPQGLSDWTVKTMNMVFGQERGSKKPIYFAFGLSAGNTPFNFGDTRIYLPANGLYIDTSIFCRVMIMPTALVDFDTALQIYGPSEGLNPDNDSEIKDIQDEMDNFSNQMGQVTGPSLDFSQGEQAVQEAGDALSSSGFSDVFQVIYKAPVISTVFVGLAGFLVVKLLLFGTK